MRKVWFCVPMITLLLLTACGAGGQGNEAEQMALTIRGEYLEQKDWTTQAAITADYGQRVYQYELTAVATGEEITLSLTAPQTVAGITARVTGKDSVLEYDGMSVETGVLDSEGLTPVSAIPVLLEAARSGYMSTCTLEEETGLLRIDCSDPEGTPGQGREITLWFTADGHALSRGDILVDGFRVITCEFTNFTKG